MKQTYNVNVGGRAYNIDTDAYELLDKYLGDIASRLQGPDAESMEDIEARVADIFDERVSTQMQVVNLEMVRRAMAIIGRPEIFGGQKRDFAYRNTGNAAGAGGTRRLYRSADDKMIGGVCAGLADYFGVDPAIARLLAIIGLFVAGATFWAYIIMWIVVPMAPYSIPEVKIKL